MTSILEPNIAVGQVWVDQDPREQGQRWVRVRACDEHFVFTETVRIRDSVSLTALGRRSRSRRTSFLRRYRLQVAP